MVSVEAAPADDTVRSAAADNKPTRKARIGKEQKDVGVAVGPDCFIALVTMS